MNIYMLHLISGNLGSHIYDRIADVAPGYQQRASGVYDEIPEIPIPSKDRADSTGSTDSNRSFGRRTPDRLMVEEDKRAMKKNIADKVLRRRSFVKEKPNLAPKTSLNQVSSGGVVLVPTSAQAEDKRGMVDLTLPVNENRGILKLFKTLKRGSATPKTRGGCSNDLM